MTKQQIETAIKTCLNLESKEDQENFEAAIKHLKDPKHHNLLLIAVLTDKNAKKIIDIYADLVIEQIYPNSIETAAK